MGCFDEVCALSRTAIHRGDPILIIYWAPHKSSLTQEVEDIFPDKSTYEALQVLRKQASWESGKYEETDQWELGGRDFQVLRGRYNDYGWIETDSVSSERPDYPAKTRIWPWVLVHEWAAKYALENIGGYDLDAVLADDPILAAKYIAQYAFVARIQLFYPDHLLGAQYFDNDEVRMQIDLCRRTLTFLETRFNEDEAEDEE